MKCSRIKENKDNESNCITGGERIPHGSVVLEMRRYVSSIATSNQKDLLTDLSDSRRFICIEVTGVIDTNRLIDYEQLYA